MQHSSVSLLTALIFTVVVFLLGAAWAVMRRANKDYKTLKNAVKPARKTFWSTFWRPYFS